MSRYQLLPPLTDEEYAALEADIVANGVLQPILVDEHNVTIDGHHRKQIADKHGLRCPSIKCPPNLTDEQKRSLSVGMNVHRRHLSREQRRELIAKSLIADPELSDRQHAERVGASPTTVGDVRGQLEADGMVSKLDTRTGKDGVAQPAVKVTVRESKSTTTEGVNPVTGEIVGAGKEGKPAPVPTPLDYDRDAEQEWEDEVHPPRPAPDPEPVALPGPTLSEHVLSAIQSVYDRLLNRYPADAVASELDHVVADNAERLAFAVTRWAETIRESHPRTLRAVKGGRS